MFMLLNKRAVLHAANARTTCFPLSLTRRIHVCVCVCICECMRVYLCNGRMQHENGVWLATFYLLVLWYFSLSLHLTPFRHTPFLLNVCV